MSFIYQVSLEQRSGGGEGLKEGTSGRGILPKVEAPQSCLGNSKKARVAGIDGKAVGTRSQGPCGPL